MDELINLMLMGSDDNIKKEAVLCLSKVSWFLSVYRAPTDWFKLYFTCQFYPTPKKNIRLQETRHTLLCAHNQPLCLKHVFFSCGFLKQIEILQR